MAIAATELTWDGSDDEDPRRPSTDDLGGDTKDDDEEYPPDDVEHFTAAGWNQKVRQISAMAKAVAASKLEVRFTTGTPYVARVTGPRSDLTTATFTVTDNGTGLTSITWPANTFPPHQCSPTGLSFISSSSSVVAGHYDEITNGIQVRSFVGGVATDVPFTITIN